jgi:hypothetical protein
VGTADRFATVETLAAQTVSEPVFWKRLLGGPRTLSRGRQRPPSQIFVHLGKHPLDNQFANGMFHPFGIAVVAPRDPHEGAIADRGFIQTFRYANTHEIGIYLLRPPGVARSRPIAYAVNADPDEGDPTKIEREELEKLAGGAPLVFADNPDDLSRTFALLREGKSLWGVFLTLVLVGLVFETFLSNRLSPTTK